MEALQDLFNQHSRRLATLATVILIVLMGVSIARVALFAVEEQGTQATLPGLSPAARTSPSEGEKVDIPSLNVFGQLNEAAPQVVEAPETRLNLELQGVFVAPDPDDSSAIVAERNKSGELYNIGDQLPGNAILESVFDDYILIKRGGRVEKLQFPDASIRQQFAARSSGQASSRLAQPDSTRLENIRERIAERRRELMSPRQNVTIPSPPATNAIHDQLVQYKARLKSEPDAVLNEVGLQPVKPGEANGYKLAGEVPEQVLTRVGLQRGDVILSVNGTPVGNISNDRALLDQAMTAGRVRVQVQRGARQFYLTVPVP